MDLPAEDLASIAATEKRLLLFREVLREPLGQAFLRLARAMGGDEDVHGQDTMQEKLSLADRFGIVLIFRTPDREQYLEIARTPAAQAGVDLEPADLEERALRWAAWHGGLRGRSARQFVEQLSGEMLVGRLDRA